MNNYCPYCMEPINSDSRCPVCGGILPYTAPTHHLACGTVLNERYLVGAAIGEGGFGITYIGRDLNLDRKTAVKEYFPNGYANRNNETSNALSERGTQPTEEYFSDCRSHFLKEARILARFPRESGIVNVSDFFEENNTAYIVMEYLDGKTLSREIKENGVLSTKRVMELFTPIMEALRKIHAEGLIHRDISPDNIMLIGGKAVLLDFGAARNISAIAQKSLSVVLKPGYAPEEQYRSRGDQGAWTDIYALCATIYKCITGVTPTDSAQRVHSDDVKSPSQLGADVSPEFERALMKGMSVHQGDRFQTVDELMKALGGSSSEKLSEDDIPTVYLDKAVSQDDIPTSYLENQGGGAGGAPQYSQSALAVSQTAPQSSVPTAYKEASPDANFYALPVVMPAAEIYPQRQNAPLVAAAAPAKKKSRKLLFIGLPLLALVTALAVMLTVRVAGIPSDSSLVYNNTLISSDLIKRIARNKNLESLSFVDCEFQDGAESALGELDRLETLSIKQCCGLQSLGFVSELDSADQITLSGSGLDDEMLAGVALAPALDRLDISENDGITSLSFLEDAVIPEDFNTLTLSGTSVSDLSPLDRCKGLEYLYADNCDITRLFTSLPLLRYFSAAYNSIDDISALSGSPDLLQLHLSHNKLTEIDALAGCVKLNSLDLDDNDVTTLSPLGELSALKSVHVNRNKLTSLAGLENALGLQTLFAASNKITELSGIENCTVLVSVSLGGNEITDVSVLEKSKSTLKTLLLGGINLKNTRLRGYTSLEILDITGCSATELPEGCGALVTLFASDNDITSIKPLEHCGSLQNVFLANNDIYYIGELYSNKLRVFDLSGNHINFAEYHSVEYEVSLYGNPIGERVVIPKETAERLSEEYGTDIQAKLDVGFSDGIKMQPSLKLAIPYYEGIDTAYIGKEPLRVIFVDCPKDKQLKLKNEIIQSSGNTSTVDFMTLSEADALREKDILSLRAAYGLD